MKTINAVVAYVCLLPMCTTAVGVTASALELPWGAGTFFATLVTTAALTACGLGWSGCRAGSVTCG